MSKAVIAIGLALSVAGCGMAGPDYARPHIDVQTRFIAGGASSLGDAATIAWWEALNDPFLNALIARGAAQNLDIRAALERISAAEAALDQTGLNAQTGGSLDAGVQSRDFGDGARTTRSVTADARYVLDLYGGNTRRQQQAIASFEAAQFDAGTVRLAYLTELTNSYIQARYYQEAAQITREIITSRRRTLSLVSTRVDAGEETELERQQARSLLLTAQASLPSLEANFEVQVFRIATLLAEPAGPIMQHMQRGAAIPRPAGRTATGVPADLLRNRPDVRFAEQNLIAATAAIGVAEAQLYPSLSLNGSVALGSVEGWSFGPALTLPVFNRGLLQARSRAAAARAREAELQWRNSVLIAVEDVQNGLTLCNNWSRQVQLLGQAGSASQRVLDLSRELYGAENMTLTDLIEAERNNATSRLARADAARNYVLGWVRLQVALGQGWRAPQVVTGRDIAGPRITADPLGLTARPRARAN